MNTPQRNAAPPEVHIPVEVAKLAVTGMKPMRIGNRRFDLIVTIGRVTYSKQDEEMNARLYTLADPRVSEHSISVYIYDGLNTYAQPSIFEDGTMLFVFGRLTEIGSPRKNVLRALRVRQLTDIAEYIFFCHESILAYDWHSKVRQSNTPTRNSPSVSIPRRVPPPPNPVASNTTTPSRAIPSTSTPSRLLSQKPLTNSLNSATPTPSPLTSRPKSLGMRPQKRPYEQSTEPTIPVQRPIDDDFDDFD